MAGDGLEEMDVSENADHVAPSKVPVEFPDDRSRFELELEFVQCLSKPSYLNYLAINRFFENEAFLNYLKYLKYWQRPEYAQFIVYPHCLAFLDIIENETFRQAIKRDDFTTLIHSQQFYHWQYFLNNRYREAAEAKGKQASS